MQSGRPTEPGKDREFDILSKNQGKITEFQNFIQNSGKVREFPVTLIDLAIWSFPWFSLKLA